MRNGHGSRCALCGQLLRTSRAEAEKNRRAELYAALALFTIVCAVLAAIVAGILNAGECATLARPR